MTEPQPSSAPEPDPGEKPPPEDPPGLGEQIGATRSAAQRLVGAHVELAKAEIGEVVDEVKKVVFLAGLAIAAAISASLLLGVGLPLFLGEWIFGSIGWGILHGLLLLMGIAVSSVVVALGVAGAAVGRGLAVGALVGVIVGAVLALTDAWSLAGESLLPLAAPDSRALGTALLVLPIVVGVLLGVAGLVRTLRGGDDGTSMFPPTIGERVAAAVPTGLYVGWLAAFLYAYAGRLAWPEVSIVGVGVAAVVVAIVILAVIGTWRPGFALVAGLAIGSVLGVVVALLIAVDFGRRVSAAIGVTVGLITWIGMMGVEVARRGVDTEELKNRFYPQKTIDITKETIEWARARMPLSRRS